MLSQNVIPFLNELSKNNNKDWFTKNKSWYQQAHKDFIAFVDDLIPQMAIIDPSLQGITAKDSVYRIYRDVRFSKDKTPYKMHFGANIAAGGRKSKLAGYYLHIEPSGTSITGGGIFGPEAPVLKAIRNEFYQVPDEVFDILNEEEFKKHFNGFWEKDKLKLAPKGFPKDFEHIDLLKNKSFLVIHDLSKKDIESEVLIGKLCEVYRAMYPLNRLINTIIKDANLG